MCIFKSSNFETVFIFYFITVDSLANWQTTQIQVLKNILFHYLNREVGKINMLLKKNIIK